MRGNIIDMTRKYEDYIDTITKVVKYFCKTHKDSISDFEDYKQEMWFVFDRCNKSFNPAKSKFETYLINSCKFKLRNLYYNNSLYYKAEDIDEHEEIFFTYNDTEDSLSTDIFEYMGNHEDSEILQAYFVEDKRQKDIAYKFGEPLSTINRKIMNFKKEVREVFKK